METILVTKCIEAHTLYSLILLNVERIRWRKKHQTEQKLFYDMIIYEFSKRFAAYTNIFEFV